MVRGRVYDNIFVERLWRTVKYEEVYLHDYPMVSEARNGLKRYFLFYNRERLHSSLGNRTPHEVYFKQPIPLNTRQASQTMHPIHPTFFVLTMGRGSDQPVMVKLDWV